MNKMIYIFGYTCNKKECECKNEKTQHYLTVPASTMRQAVKEAGFTADEHITFAGMRYPGGIGYCPYPKRQKGAVR